MYDEERDIIWNNYLNEVKKNIDDENAIVLFVDITIKEYSKKLEDLVG